MRIPLVAILLLLATLACGSGTDAPRVSTATVAGADANATAPSTLEGEATTTAAPTPTATTPPVGLSRNNPVPLNASVDVEGDMSLTILDVVRPADDIVAAGNMFNTEAESGQEYVQVTVQLICSKPENETCNVNTFEFSFVGVDGNLRDAEWFVAGVEQMLESGDFLGGATKTGRLFGIVAEGDLSAVLVHKPLLFGNATYLALGE